MYSFKFSNSRQQLFCNTLFWNIVLCLRKGYYTIAAVTKCKYCNEMYYEKNGCICCKEMMRKFTEAGLDLYNKEHLEFISSNAEAGGVSKSWNIFDLINVWYCSRSILRQNFHSYTRHARLICCQNQLNGFCKNGRLVWNGINIRIQSYMFISAEYTAEYCAHY